MQTSHITKKAFTRMQVRSYVYLAPHCPIDGNMKKTLRQEPALQVHHTPFFGFRFLALRGEPRSSIPRQHTSDLKVYFSPEPIDVALDMPITTPPPLPSPPPQKKDHAQPDAEHPHDLEHGEQGHVSIRKDSGSSREPEG